MIILFKKLTLADPTQGILIYGRTSLDSRISAEVADFPEADEIESFDRGNLQKQFGFAATREHGSEDDAEKFEHEHAEEVLGKGLLEVRGGAAEWVKYYQGATCVRCSTYAEGVGTFSTYEFVVGLSSKKKT